MKKQFCILLQLVLLLAFTVSCDSDKQNPDPDSNESITTTSHTVQSRSIPGMLDIELNSVTVGKLSTEHEYYKKVIKLDSESKDYIKEISIYDKEIDDTFVIHLSLPPECDSSKKYPMLVMTDGIWRLTDHPELRKFMKKGETDPVIIASIGYPDGYDYRGIRERDLVNKPENFLHFIIDNLVPYLEANYPVDKENMTLAGHSYGGYWSLYALFNSDTIGKNTFKNYYIGSPSFQAYTGDQNIATFEEAYHSRNTSLNCNIYVTVGDKEGDGFISPITDFVDLLNERNYDGLNLSYEIMDGYEHNTVFKPSIKQAMQMFYGKRK